MGETTPFMWGFASLLLGLWVAYSLTGYYRSRRVRTLPLALVVCGLFQGVQAWLFFRGQPYSPGWLIALLTCVGAMIGAIWVHKR